MSDTWRDRCKDKLTTPARAVAQARRGERIVLSAGSAAPLGLIRELVAPDAPLGDNEILHLLTLGDAPYTRPEFAGRFRHNALFIGPNVRQAVAEGRADYTPVFLSEIPALIRSGRIRVDAALLSVTPPDAQGYCNLGTHVDIALAAAEAARVVVAEVNPQMPRVHGPGRLHLDQIDALAECDHPLPELPPAPAYAETEAIAHYVAEMVPDGATLQLGIGNIPNAVARLLSDRHDLGLHTEMFSDGVVELARRGVLTGRRKKIDVGKLISSFVFGTKLVYEFVRENPAVELHPVDYTNDPFVIAQNDDMIAINTALEIDLTGQVCADSIGARFYSGIGGQVDFIRGAARGKRGKPIIALPATAEDGTISRIVPRLADGAGVVTTRGDVHYVVTEYGAVNLHGRNVRERALALISIAHPKFRPWLLAESKRRKYIRYDQPEPPLRAPVYPKQLELHAKAKDGLPVLLRPVKPTDERLLHDMFYRLSRETLYQRFFTVKKYLPHENLQRFCTIDYDQDMTLVASIREGEVERLIGWALYYLDPATRFAEAAFLVADEFQGRGVGTLLLRRLTEIAEARGARGFTAVVLAHNAPMLRVFEKCGYPVETRPDSGALALRIPFEAASRAAWKDA